MSISFLKSYPLKIQYGETLAVPLYFFRRTQSIPGEGTDIGTLFRRGQAFSSFAWGMITRESGFK